MKTKIIFSTFLIITFLLTSCGQGIAAPVALPTADRNAIRTQAAQTIVAAFTQTALVAPPTDIPTPTLLPTFTPNPLVTIMPSPTAVPPYPTASVVKSNAVAFIERDSENNLSLWVANVDGSGERKIVESIGKWSDTTNYFLRWSPGGKWISYISGGEVWIVSPDGSNKRDLLPIADKSAYIVSYNWSPSNTQLAYVQTDSQDIPLRFDTVKILNLETGEIYELSSHKTSPYGNTIIRWSPDGQYLVFNKSIFFIVFDVASRKVKKEIVADASSGCPSADNTAPNWSSNSEWFFHFHGSGSSSFFWICLSGLDGSNHTIDVDGAVVSRPVWDKTGNFLYFIARNSHGDLNLNADQQLQRYDVRSKKLERLLSLGQKYQSGWSVSMSPDGRTLEINARISESQQSYILMDLKSLSVIKKFTLEYNCVRSGDSENFICISQSNGHSTFHRLNIQTGETTTISGEHTIESWAVPPIATTS